MELNLSTLKHIRSLNGPILITGHTGFKGVWLGLLLEALRIPYVGYSLAPEQTSLFNRLGRTNKANEVFADVLDLEAFKKFLNQHNVQAVIHMAAQSLVLRSYQIPLETYAVNALGTANVLSASTESKNVRAVVVVTTDKVYRNLNNRRDFIETDPLQGHDPYSASKVAAESAVDVWRKVSEQTGGPQIFSVRAGNVIGGGDWAENRLIPDLVRGFSSGQIVEIRSPNSTRPWQHVLDPLIGYLLALEAALQGSPIGSFNFGPTSPSLPVKVVSEIARKNWPEKIELSYAKEVRNSEAITLGLDPTLAINVLKWIPAWSQEEAVASSIKWWVNVLKKGISPIDACLIDITKVLNQAHEITNNI
jgi:CDP-glucose 4,6-dehydratase